MQCAAKRAKPVDYRVVIRGGVEVLNEVNEVGRYVVIEKNFPESVVGNRVESLVDKQWADKYGKTLITSDHWVSEIQSACRSLGHKAFSHFAGLPKSSSR